MTLNAIGFQREQVEPEEWERSEMRVALWARDVTQVYRLLQKGGFSQQRIAALTGQSQPEVSAIIHGRKVMAYDVLARIADGLGIPRGYMGLAYDPLPVPPELTALPGDGEDGSEQDAAARFGRAGTGDPPQEEQAGHGRRAFLGIAAALTVGATALAELAGPALADVPTPVPGRVGLPEVDRLRVATDALRTLDYQHGGGSCRDAVLAQLRTASELLTADASDEAGRALRVGLADLHNLAGWTSLDVGLDGAARGHFLRALQLARLTGSHDLVANVLYRTGRISLHRGDHAEALKLFELGRLAAREARSPLCDAVLASNTAWAQARLGDGEAAKRSLDEAGAALAKANLAESPSWSRFYDESDLEGHHGMVCLALGRSDPAYHRRAADHLAASAAMRAPGMARSRAFDLTALAVAHLRSGDVDHGALVGIEAADLVARMTSARAVDWLTPLAKELAKHPEDAQAREASERLRGLVRAA